MCSAERRGRPGTGSPINRVRRLKMQCPVCDEKLREVEKYGVMVDICPGCKGVWLDRGELEKIVQLEERGGLDRGPRAAAEDRDRDYHEKRDGHDHDRGDDDRHDGHGYRGVPGKAKKRSLLSDLLDGFGD
jgi:uncharacterized protein